NIGKLEDSLIVKLLNGFEDYPMNNRMVLKQIWTIIEYSNFDESYKKELQFFYIDSKIIEKLIIDTVEENELFSSNNYINIGKKENNCMEDKNVKVVISRIAKL